MNQWWSQLDLIQKVLWCIAVPSSVIFLIQTIMTFAGMDSDGTAADFNGDLVITTEDDGSSDNFQLFTLRNFINFFLAFSWTGIAFYHSIENKALLALLAAFSGTVLVAAVMLMFYFMGKTQKSGTLNIVRALEKSATVYIPVPGMRGGMGKVHIHLQGSLRELDAMTNQETMPTGTIVQVTSIEDHILIVSRYKK